MKVKKAVSGGGLAAAEQKRAEMKEQMKKKMELKIKQKSEDKVSPANLMCAGVF